MLPIEQIRAKIQELERARAATNSQGAKLTFELLINMYKEDLRATDAIAAAKG